jgi:predicted DNA-binding protein with PD1-like motif
MRVVPIRLTPGTDLRLGLEQVLQEQKEQAGWVLSGIGSLSVAPLRLAGQKELSILEGDLEIITLAGSLSADGAHLHISVADSQGRVSGGHLAMGATVRTTAEVLVVLLPACSFRRGEGGGFVPTRASQSRRIR